MKRYWVVYEPFAQRWVVLGCSPTLTTGGGAWVRLIPARDVAYVQRTGNLPDEAGDGK